MSVVLEPKPTVTLKPAPVPARKVASRSRSMRSGQSLLSYGEPMIWLTGGALSICLLMIFGLLCLILLQGISTFWPQPVVQIKTADGAVLAGEIARRDTYKPTPGAMTALPADFQAKAQKQIGERNGFADRILIRIGNYELTNEHFQWVDEFAVAELTAPEWMLVLERMAWGRFYGTPKSFLIDGQATASTPEEVWKQFNEHRKAIHDRWQQRRELETHDVGAVNSILENARLDLREVELAGGTNTPEYRTAQADFEKIQQWAQTRFNEIQSQIAELNKENARFQMVLVTADGKEAALKLEDIVLAYPANQLNFIQKLGIYLTRWSEFLIDAPREANSEGGVFPAIFGTVVMTLIMSILVVPFGVLAALYLREYAKPGFIVSAVRIAINNLAGVPSIVFGVFGLGFFCYIVGASIDRLLFEARLPSPTFGKGGIMWASFTLALLTLPVVIVATEEALAAVPSSMREGSYACGASKWQTIRRIVLPRALPGIMTGMILAMARGAGEVAPLMLVGAVKLAPELPFDSLFPYLHPERSFMHLGFHIYDLGFQSQNSEAAKPMVFTTTLLLIALVATLNVAAVWIRGRLRRRFASSQF